MAKLIELIVLAIALTWAMRRSLHSELERAGFFQAERPLSDLEEEEVVALAQEGKFNAAEALRDFYRFQV